MIEIELSNGDRYVSYGNLEYSRAGKSQKHLSAPDADCIFAYSICWIELSTYEIMDILLNIVYHLHLCINIWSIILLFVSPMRWQRKAINNL